MYIRYGFVIELSVSQPTPLITLLDVHPTRAGDIVEDAGVQLGNARELHRYRDSFGNVCRRLTADPGLVRLSGGGVICDSGVPDAYAPDAAAVPVAELPDEVLPLLLGSRYCDTDKLAADAWARFGAIEDGWTKVQAICDFVHNRLRFDYMQANVTRSAHEALEQQTGVCRDFAHLAISLCRCMNIPARYCTGYLGDIGVPPDSAPMDFSAWFEAYIGHRWYVFDARHNRPRIGRILVARGRDAAEVPIVHSFGAHTLVRFEVTAGEFRPATASGAEGQMFSPAGQGARPWPR